ncbi:MAG: hypothetical protein ACYDCK_10155 [Thermoplasmatota archaeon]
MPLGLPERKRWLAISIALVLGVGALGAVAANVSATHVGPPPDNDNDGTVKVKTLTNDTQPDNDPHVSCDFWVEGMNMEVSSGTLWIQSWPPTGNMTTVLTDNWTADSTDSNGDHHFINGPYNLTAGHYKLFVTNDGDHVKMKVFWVDACGDPTPPEDCRDTELAGDGQNETRTDNDVNDTTDLPCVPPPPPEIPFFPSTLALGLGSMGALVGTVLIFRRKA